MLPHKFQWLEDIGPLPKLLAVLLQYNGLKEVPGLKNNPVIMEMAKNIGVADIYTGDEMSWCALFINHGIKLSGKPVVDYKGDRYNLLRAKWLLHWGEEVPEGEEALADVVILDRPGGGHVGLRIAESKDTVWLYGGNQSNAAGFAEFAKHRIVGSRRFYAIGPPPSVKKYFMDSAGKLSTNEA